MSEATLSGKYKAYPEYKDSGVEWIGDIPSHWEKKRIKETATLINGHPFDSSMFVAGEGTPLVRIRDIRSKITEVGFIGEVPKEALINKGDILIGMDGDFNVAMWKGGKAALNQRVACVRLSSKLLQKYIFYSLPFSMKVINDLTYFTTVKHLSSFDILKSFYTLPPEEELEKVVNFLDHETAKIDTLIEKQQQLIQLLQEKRQAVISHAVTKGLPSTTSANTPMRDSGVEWLGEIPAHWEIWKLSHAYNEIGSGTTPPSNEEKWYEGDIPWVTTGELRENIIYNTYKNISNKTIFQFSTLKKYPIGSVVIAMYGATIGRLGILGVEATTNQACCVFTKSAFINNVYLFYWLQAYKKEIINLSSGGGQPNINQEKVASLKISAPNLDEQIKIVSYLEKYNKKFKMLEHSTKKQIELLQERRTALISAAVTGKIDVRHHASHPEGGLQPSKSTVHGDL